MSQTENSLLGRVETKSSEQISWGRYFRVDGYSGAAARRAAVAAVQLFDGCAHSNDVVLVQIGVERLGGLVPQRELQLASVVTEI